MEGYNELSMLVDNASEVGLDFEQPTIVRTSVTAPSGNQLSALVWGDAPPEFVLVHGGAQNAHTWDTVALALGRPLVAIDLPGHGHSDWRQNRDYRPQAMAEDVSAVIRELAPDASTLVGMSLGGLTALAALADAPDLADRLVLVDITPGVNKEKAAAVIAFIDGPSEFESFDVLLERTMAHNPTRSRASLHRGVLHNARPLDDGRWVWRYDRPDTHLDVSEVRFANLWDAISAVEAPMLLVQGGLSPVVDDEDISELQRRQPAAQVIVIDAAGHSVQGDQPRELARILDEFSR
ncbi:MAG: alpha/beta hydrolase [Actinomycetes bacterium]